MVVKKSERKKNQKVKKAGPKKQIAGGPKAEKKEQKGKISETDDDFIKRITGIKEEAAKKASREIESSFSGEIEEFRAKGKQAAKDLEEIEECKKIVKEFEANPPIIKSVHINGVVFEYSYEDSNVVKKIELLKKHGFSFLSATKDTSISTISFRTFGKVYVKRGMQKILLPESSRPQTVPEVGVTGMGFGRALDPKNLNFILEDGDIIATDTDSYLLDISDIKCASETNRARGLYIFPNSEVRIKISRSQTEEEPASMDPSQVPEIIKQRSSRTVITYLISSYELIKGLFKLGLADPSRDPNTLFKLPSNYPQIGFKSSGELGAAILEKTLAATRLQNPKMAELLEAHYRKPILEARSRVCDTISGFIELCGDGSVVVFGTMQSVMHKDTGKIAVPVLPTVAGKNITSNLSFFGKITAIGSSLYSTDLSKNPDPRIEAIARHYSAFEQHRTFSSMRKDLENQLKEAEQKLAGKKKIAQRPVTEKEKEEKERERAELMEELEYLKQVGDTLAAEAVEAQIRALDKPKSSGAVMQQMRAELMEELEHLKRVGNTLAAEAVEAQIRILDKPESEELISIEVTKKQLEWCKKEIEKINPDELKTAFPPYGSPSQTDLV